MSVRARILGFVCIAALLPAGARAEGIDTEHLFAFMIGSDVGNVGEKEFQSQATARFSKAAGNYRAMAQEFELEFVPVRNVRIEVGSTFASHDIAGVPGFADRFQFGFQGILLDLRYRFLDRETGPFGLILAAETHADRLDETTAAPVRKYGTEVTLAVDRELIPDVSVAAVNLIYQPEWTRFSGAGQTEREATIGAAMAVMAQIRPGFFLGGEARYLRKYDGIGLDDFEGHALFIGPTVFVKLSDRSRLTANWSFQAWGRPAGSTAALDLLNFERHQARLVLGVNF
ncbi:hypothetical protein [uncultured Bradyrhizobium sp.]|uniref:hypothetical protein n=1 Tax=uncultured Bradyrhizobium sp. TaxID=199684 RepID=UPI0035CC23FD